MAKRPRNLVFTSTSVDRKKSMPLHLQLYRELRDTIVSGRFCPKTRLPSTRSLAADVGVSRNTVLNAFDQLAAEGYLEARGGSGTYVTGALPDETLWSNAGLRGGARQLVRGATLSGRGREIANISPFFPPVKAKPFRHGLPALDSFPLKLWAQLAGRRLRRMRPELLGYGDPAGYYPLREAIVSYLATSRAVHCAPEQVVIVGGSQQAIYLASLALLDNGDYAWIEDPGYLGARGALQMAGARLVPVPVDEQGLDVAAGISLRPDARLVYLTPSNQYPTAATMSLPRRLELLEWAARSGAWIVEDDYDSEFRFRGRPLAALQGLDRHGRVIYLGTFSKLLAPTLRLGYLVVPPQLVDAFSAASALISRHPPSLEQIVLTDFIEKGHLARHIRRMRVLYMERQAEFVAAARRELGGLLEVTPPEAGTHLVGLLPEWLDDREAAKAAAARGVETRPFSSYCLGQHRNGLVLGYGAFSGGQIRNGMRKLAAALSECRPPMRRAKGVTLRAS